MASHVTWSDEDYVALRNYELRLERDAQMGRLDELHEARMASDREADAPRPPSDLSAGDDGD